MLFNSDHSISFVFLTFFFFQVYLITESSGFQDESLLLYLRISFR